MNKSLNAMREELTTGVAVEQLLKLKVGECRIDVRTNSALLNDHLSDYFRLFASDDGPADLVVSALQMPEPDLGLEFVDWPREGGKTGRKDTYCDVEGGRVVRKVRTGMQYLVGPKPLAFGDCLKNQNQVVNFVASQYMTWVLHRGWALCHAAGVVVGGRGLAVAAFSGGGKSTLALQLMRRGLMFSSNDRLLVRDTPQGGLMSGVPKLPRINPGTALHNPDLRGILPEGRAEKLHALGDDLWDLEEKYDVDVGRIYGDDRWQLNAPLSAFFILNWTRGASDAVRVTRVDPAERLDLLEAVMKSPGPFYVNKDGSPPPAEVTQPRAATYLEALAQVDVFEVSGGVDFDRATEACLEIAGA